MSTDCSQLAACQLRVLSALCWHCLVYRTIFPARATAQMQTSTISFKNKLCRNTPKAIVGLTGNLFFFCWNSVKHLNASFPHKLPEWQLLTRRFFSSWFRWVLSASFKLRICFSDFFLSVKNWFCRRLKSALIESVSFWRASNSFDFSTNCCSRSESCCSEMSIFSTLARGPELAVGRGFLPSRADCIMTCHSLHHWDFQVPSDPHKAPKKAQIKCLLT